MHVHLVNSPLADLLLAIRVQWALSRQELLLLVLSAQRDHSPAASRLPAATIVTRVLSACWEVLNASVVHLGVLRLLAPPLAGLLLLDHL